MKTHLLIGLGMLVSLTIATANAKPAAADSPVTQSRIVELTRSQPMLFEINRGQAEANVQFQARGQGYGISLAPGEAVLSLRAFPNKSEQATGRSATVRMRLVGADADAKLTGLEQQAAMVNYFRGNDPKLWHTQIPTFARVKAARVYPGVDLVYYGNQRQLEFDFVVAPGADPNQIALKFEGAEKLEIDAQGNLVLHTPGGQLIQHKPVIYQTVNSVRKEIAGGYVLRNKQQVSFQVAAYDHTQPLTIDPALSYSSFLGGSGDDRAVATAVDTAGNVYVVGYTTSTNFPIQAALQPTSPVGPGVSIDGFVTKLSPTGTLLYSTYLGGTNYASDVSGIAFDSDGNAYLSGSTGASDFPTTVGAYRTNLASIVLGIQDAFVTKLNPSGSALIYSTYLGGRSFDDGLGIAVDSARNALVTGRTDSTNFPTLNALQPVYGGAGPGLLGDAFVTKINPAGSALVYSTYLGGSGDEEQANEINYQGAIAVDAAGNAYVTGSTSSTDFPTTLGAFQPSHAPDGASSDAFLTKIGPSGSLVYSTYLGGSSRDEGVGVAVDAGGSAYVVGLTFSCNFPFRKQAVDGAGVQAGAFVTKFNTSGSALLYSSYLGGQGGARAVAVDSVGHAFVTGRVGGAFQTYCAVQPVLAGSLDAFVAELAADGASFVYSTYLGGTADDVGTGIALDSSGNAYVAGMTFSTDFPTANALQPAFGGGPSDAFVAKIAANPACGPGPAFGPFIPWGNCVACQLVFTGFLSPIAGADATGGSFNSPLRTFKMNSTIPVKFSTTCNGLTETTGVHTLQVIKYSDATTPGTPIDATPSDAATTGDQFRLTGTDWHFNLDTRATGMSKGIWLFVATLSDGSQHTAWIQIK